jgi:hypothetical protein
VCSELAACSSTGSPEFRLSMSFSARTWALSTAMPSFRYDALLRSTFSWNAFNSSSSSSRITEMSPRANAAGTTAI